MEKKVEKKREKEKIFKRIIKRSKIIFNYSPPLNWGNAKQRTKRNETGEGWLSKQREICRAKKLGHCRIKEKNRGGGKKKGKGYNRGHFAASISEE